MKQTPPSFFVFLLMGYRYLPAFGFLFIPSRFPKFWGRGSGSGLRSGRVFFSPVASYRLSPSLFSHVFFFFFWSPKAATDPQSCFSSKVSFFCGKVLDLFHAALFFMTWPHFLVRFVLRLF